MALITGPPLAVTFGILGNFISVLVYFAPLPTFCRIYRKKSTEDFQCLPYLVALFSAMLWFYYALLKQDDFLLITINSFGCFIESIYIIMYIVYAPRCSRNSTLKILVTMNMVVFPLIVLLTKFVINSDHLRALIVGWICVAFSVCVFAAPLNIMARVIRTRSVEFMPFTLSFFLTMSAIVWFAYGVFQKDKCIALPNVVGFLLGFLQMVLYGIYRNAEKRLEEIKVPEHIKSVVILSPLGASEIYPVQVQPYCNDDNEQIPEKSIQISTYLKPVECPV